MANRFARKTGNLNAADVWSDTPSGTASVSFIPTTGDVAMANGFAITVNVDATFTEARNDANAGATAGGYFDLISGVTLTADVLAGTANSVCVRFQLAAPAIAYIAGNVTAGGGAGATAVANLSSGTLAITGNVTGGAFAVTAQGVYNLSNGTLNITGTVTGGLGSAGAYNNAAGTMTITGTVIGGSAATAYGAQNNGAGIMTVNGSVYGSPTSVAPGVFGTVGSYTYANGSGYASAAGCMPFGGYVRFDFTASSLMYVRDKNLVQRTYIPAEYSVSNGVPAIADVRNGTSYALGALTGTCYVPAASSVVAGVPVDNTVGTAALLTQADVRSAIGLASANLDAQLAAIPTSGLTAQQVWEYVTRTLTAGSGITAQDVWEYATRELTTSAGGATAQQVWEYTTRSLTEAPDVPTVEEIAAEVRTELTPELTRVANCATVESTGDQLAGLL